MSAHHWTVFGVEHELFEPYEVDGSHGWVGISVHSELPRDEAGKLLPRFGNRYYGSLIDLEIDEEYGAPRGLVPTEARRLAAMIMAAADLADAIDKPDTNPACGHWAPCDCERAA